MPTKYLPKKDAGFGLLILACALIPWVLFLLHFNMFFLFFALIITLFFVWIWFGTIYQLDEDHFIYRSGPLKKKIPLHKIVRVRKNVRSSYGMRPALSFKYLQISYNKYDDVYIAPKDEAAFISDLINKNPSILLIEKS